jgi:hypothetical protein
MADCSVSIETASAETMAVAELFETLSARQIVVDNTATDNMTEMLQRIRWSTAAVDVHAVSPFIGRDR